MKKRLWNNKWFNYILLAIIIAFSFRILISSIDPEVFYETVKEADGRFLLLGLACMFIYWGLEAVMIHNLIKKVNPEMHFWSAIKTTFIGQYYSFLTPFASGGQPMQLYELGKDKMPMGNATAVLVSKFLLFQVTVTLYSLVLYLVKIHEQIFASKAINTFVMIGLGINTVGLTLIILMAFRPKQVSVIGHFVIEGLHKFHLLRNRERAYAKLHLLTDEYHDAMASFNEDFKNTLWLFFLSVLQLTSFFTITYLVYLALGLRGTSYMDIIALQAMLYMAVSFIPSPGTAGASEVGFSLLLGTVFTSHVLAMAILLWRGISYYFGLIFCGAFTLIVHLADKRKSTEPIG